MKKKIIILMIALFLCAAAGVGIYFGVSSNQKPVEIEDTESKYSSTLLEAPKDGTLPTDHTIEENIAYALWTMANTKEFKSVTTGTANASVATVQISNERVVKNGEAMTTMISSGIVSSGKQKYFMEDKVLLRDADKKSIKATDGGLYAEWEKSTPECVTYATIMKRYGWYPFQATGYIICEDTYINKDKMTMVMDSDGNYVISFDLNPDDDYAPFYYKREVATNGESTMIPKFSMIHMELTIDSSWRILVSNIQEEYKVKSMGVEAKTKTDCHEVFTFENVEFDADSYSYFQQYKDLTAADDSSENNNTATDPVSIIVESLQNADGSDTVLELSLGYGDFNTTGLVALNITDLTNIKVLAQIDQLYVEYSDSIYISVGGVSVKANMDDLTQIIGKITALFPSEGDSESALDTAALLEDLSASKITEEESDVYIETNLNLMGIELPIHFHMKHENDSYTLVSADVVVSLNGKNLNLSIVSTNKKIEVKNHDEFADLKNLEFIVDDVVTIIEKKAVDFEVSTSYEGVELSVVGTVDFSKDLLVSAEANVSYKELDFVLDLAYTNETIYLSYGNVNLKITTEDLTKLIGKFTDSSSLEISLDTLDIEGILKTVFSIDYDKLIEELKMTNSSLDLSIDLTDLVESIGKIKLAFADTEYGLSGYVSVLNFEVDLKVGELGYEAKELTKNYQNLAYLDTLIDSIMDIVNEKAVELSLAASYKDIQISANGIVEFKDSVAASVELTLKYKSVELPLEVIYLNNNIYLSYANVNLMISQNDLMTIVGKFTTSDSSSSILDSILAMDFEKLIEAILITETDVTIKADLSELSDKLSTLTAVITNNDKVNVELSMGDILANVSVTKTDKTVTLPEKNYQNLGELEGFIDTIASFLDSKKMQITLTGAYKDIKLNAVAYLDYSSELSVKADITLKYKTLDVPVTVYYFAKYEDNENVIFLSLGNSHVELLVSDITKHFDNEEMNLSDILDLVLSVDFAKVLNALEISKNTLGLSLDLSDFEKLKDLIDITNIIQISLENKENVITLSAAEIFGLEASLETFDGEITLAEAEYTNLAGLVDSIWNLVDWISNKDSIRVSLDGTVSLDSLSLVLGGYIDILAIKDYDEELVEIGSHFEMDGYITLSVSGTYHEIYLKYVNKMVYLQYGGVSIGLDVSDISGFIEEITEVLKLEMPEFDFTKLSPVLDSLTILDKSLSLDISSLLDLITTVTIALDYVEESASLSLDVDAVKITDKTTPVIDLNATVKKTTTHAVELPGTYITNSEVIDLCKTVRNILDLIDEREFNANLALTIYDNTVKHLDIAAEVSLAFSNEKWADFKISDLSFAVSAEIKEYREDGVSVKVRHIIDLVWSNDRFYVVYGTTESLTQSPSSYIKLYSDEESILSILASLTKALGVDLSFLNDFVSEDILNVDFTQLRNFVGTFMGSESSESSSDMNISEIVDSLKVIDNGVSVAVLAKAISSIIPEDKKITATIISDSMNPLRITANGIYTDYVDEEENTMITDVSLALWKNKRIGYSVNADTNALDLLRYTYNEDGTLNTVTKSSYKTSSTSTTITKDTYDYSKDEPTTSTKVSSQTTGSWYDISNVDCLVNGLLTTASTPDFQFETSVKLSVASLINVTVPVDGKVRVLEDGTPLIYVHMSVPKVSAIVTLVEKKEVYFYYRDGYVFIDRQDNDGDRYQIEVTYQDFFDDIIYYLLDFAMGMPDSVMSLITGSTSDNEDNVVNAGSVIKSFTSTETKFSLTLSLAALTGNDDLGDLSLSLNLTDVVVGHDEEGNPLYAKALTSISDVSVKLVSVITITTSKDLALTNISPTDGFTTIDMTSVEDYIADYKTSHKVAYIYEKGVEKSARSYALTFIYGKGLDNEIISATPNEEITLMDKYTTVDYDGATWKFLGWYTDKYCSEGNEYTSSLMPACNTKLYAKWAKTTYYYYNGEEFSITAGDAPEEYEYEIQMDGKTIYARITLEMLKGTAYSSFVSKYAYVDSDGITHINLYSVNENRTDYYTVSFDYDAVHFTESPYNRLQLPATMTLPGSLLPQGNYKNMEINYWYTATNEYHAGNISSLPRTDVTLKAYYSNTEFTYESTSSSVVLKSYTGANAIVVLPKYVFIDGAYKTLSVIGNSAFLGNDSITTVYFSDSIVEVKTDAFKNCKNLSTVYFNDALATVSTDAFYMQSLSSYEDNRDVCIARRFYFHSDAIVKESDLKNWLACKWNTVKKYYEQSYSIGGSGDFTNAYQIYTETFEELNANIVF